MSAEEHLNLQQFKPLSELTEREKRYVSVTSAVRGGFARPSSADRIADTKPHPQVHDPASWHDLFDKLDPERKQPRTPRTMRRLN